MSIGLMIRYRQMFDEPRPEVSGLFQMYSSQAVIASLAMITDNKVHIKGMLNTLKSNLLDHECIEETMKVLSNLNNIGTAEASELKNFITSNQVHESCDEALLTDVISVLEAKSK